MGDTCEKSPDVVYVCPDQKLSAMSVVPGKVSIFSGDEEFAITDLSRTEAILFAQSLLRWVARSL